jgi:small subunit ribosomal protein S8
MQNTISTDPIADMLSRIRNAAAVGKSEVTVPYSKMKSSVVELLKKNNFIDDVHVNGEGISKSLVVVLHGIQENARISKIDRLSKPGRRYYVSAQEIPTVKNGRGLVIISTSKGLMTGDEAKTQRIGGELICNVY